MYLCICVFVYLCICVFLYLCICVFVFLCICLFVYLCICVSVYLCIYVFVYLCIYVSSQSSHLNGCSSCVLLVTLRSSGRIVTHRSNPEIYLRYTFLKCALQRLIAIVPLKLILSFPIANQQVTNSTHTERFDSPLHDSFLPSSSC